MPKALSKLKFDRELRKLAGAKSVQPEFLELVIAKSVFLEILRGSNNRLFSEGYVKGGSGVLLRLGVDLGRATKDLDLASALYSDEVKHQFDLLVGQSWQEFSISSVRPLRPASPTNIPLDYVISSYRVSLLYGNSQWRTILVEVSKEEFKSTPEVINPPELGSIFEDLLLTPPGPVNIIPIHLQIAQKLHACSLQDSERGQDLYDIFMLASGSEFDKSELTHSVLRTFKVRGTHRIPARLEPSDLLEKSYLQQTEGLDSAPNFSAVLNFANQLLSQISKETA